MHIEKTRTLLVLAALAFLSGCGGESIARPTPEGLQPLDVESIEFVAIHPGADMSSFIELQIVPVQVAFQRGWKPSATGSRLTASQSEMENLEEEIAAIFMEAFTAGLTENERLQVVDNPAPGRLRVTPRLADVALNNLGSMTQPGTSVGRSQGHAELRLDIHDIRTGTLVARLVDKRTLGNAGGTSMIRADAGRFAELSRSWGQFIGKGLMNISVPPAPE